MKRIKFVVWGAGFRASRIIKELGSERIVAFIDSAPMKVGNVIEGKSVVSFQEYLARYSDMPIIVLPQHFSSIVGTLHQNNCNKYILYDERPTLIPEKFHRIINDVAEREDKNTALAIYGMNLFSLMLYENLLDKGFNNVCLINDKNTSIKESIIIQNKKIMVIDLKDCDNLDVDKVLLASNNFDEAVKRLFRFRIDDVWNNYNEIFSPKSSLDKFKNIHSGDRMFIVGTGPSLTFEDLERLHKNKEISMSVNTVFRAFDRTEWRPNYYVMGDSNGIKEYQNEIIDMEGPVKFILQEELSQAFDIKDNEVFKINLYSANRDIDLPIFSDDITKHVVEGGTIIYCCIQIAVYMGVNEIYLLGTDCNYEGPTQNKANHFIDNYFKDDDKQPRYIFPLEEVFMAYQVAKHYAERHGIKIYNATRGGKLEVFERVEYDSLF